MAQSVLNMLSNSTKIDFGIDIIRFYFLGQRQSTGQKLEQDPISRKMVIKHKS
jgi:hypothetical protein